MARDKGQKTFASNYEVKIAEMLDPRLLVDSKEELIKKETWPSDGDTLYMKEGMFVYVKGDGFYELVSLANILATDYSGWKKVTSESDVYFSDLLDEDAIMDIISGNAYQIEDTSKIEEFIANAKGKIVLFNKRNSSIVIPYIYFFEDRFDFSYCGVNTYNDELGIWHIQYLNSEFTLYNSAVFSDYQKKLVSGTNIKTINGKSVLGSGDLKTTYEISMAIIGGVTGGGGSGSVSSQLYIYPNKIVKPSSAITTNVIIAYNTPPSFSPTNMEEYLIEFAYTSGSISFPSTVKWQNETVPTFKSGYTYQISIVNDLACFAEFKTA